MLCKKTLRLIPARPWNCGPQGGRWRDLPVAELFAQLVLQVAAAGGQARWFEPQSRRPQTPARQLGEEVVEVVKLTRLSLYNRGVFCGGQAIRWELEDLAFDPLPSIRTINRILAREDLTHRRTGRYEPKGRAYPAWTTAVPNHVQEADFVGPVSTRTGRFHSYGVDLATGRCAVEPLLNRGGQAVIDAIWAVWGRSFRPTTKWTTIWPSLAVRPIRADWAR